MYISKLIVIRGNSGSGKGTIAKRVREKSKRKIAIVEQDYLRRFILKEKENEGKNNLDLIVQTTRFALERNYDVILEGILFFHRYGSILEELRKECPDHHFFYLDVSFEETLQRHKSKPNAHEFGEKEMREWYKPRDVTGFPGEIVIPEVSSIEDTTDVIISKSGL